VQKITPFLWFNDNVEEAMNFYVSIFKNSKVIEVKRLGHEGSGSPGLFTTVRFQIEGQEFHGLNGGPSFQFSPAISFFVDCKTQAEVDELSGKLSEGGEQLECGWVRDKFGISWQIVPSALGELMDDPDPEKANRVWDAMLKMHKIEIAELQRARDGV